MPAEPELLFHHPSRKVARLPLREFWKELMRRIGGGRFAICLITTDRQLQSLNKRFRGKDYAADVLSFPGEIAISFDRAAAQASEHGHSVDDELRILMLHGALHLAGMDHEKDSGEMARTEARWRRKLNLPAGLIERA